MVIYNSKEELDRAKKKKQRLKEHRLHNTPAPSTGVAELKRRAERYSEWHGKPINLDDGLNNKLKPGE